MKTIFRLLNTTKKKIIAILTVLVLLASAVIGLNETYFHLSFIPSWNDLYVMTGLRDDISLSDGAFKMTVRDVGNADCILLQSGDKFALVDAGEKDDGEELVAYCKQTGITRFEFVIATHFDHDHIGGMTDVIENMEIGTFYLRFMPEKYTPTTKTYEKMLTALVDHNVSVVEPEFGETVNLGDTRIAFLSGHTDYKDTNDQSIVCKATFGNTAFLLTGDAGKATENDLVDEQIDLHADVLKVGHHGSDTSSTEAFLQAVSPKYAVISCGFLNQYGHPDIEVLNRLSKQNVQVFRTDINGAVVLLSDGNTVTVTSEK